MDQEPEDTTIIEDEVLAQDGDNQISEEEHNSIGALEEALVTETAEDETPEAPDVEITIEEPPEAPAEASTMPETSAEEPIETPAIEVSEETVSEEPSADAEPAINEVVEETILEESNPSEDISVKEALVAEEVAEEIPLNEKSTEEVPPTTNDEAPAEELSAEETPADAEAPGEETNASQTPTEESLVVETPPEETPPEETPTVVISSAEPLTEEAIPESATNNEEQVIPEMDPEPQPEESVKKTKLKKGKKVGKNKSEEDAVVIDGDEAEVAAPINGNHEIAPVAEGEAEKSSAVETLDAEYNVNGTPIEENDMDKLEKAVDDNAEAQINGNHDIALIAEVEATKPLEVTKEDNELNKSEGILRIPSQNMNKQPNKQESAVEEKESAKRPVEPVSAPSLNGTCNMKSSTSFDTPKKPSIECNIGNTRVRDNGSNLANSANSRMQAMPSKTSMNGSNVVAQQRSIEEIKASVSITYCEVFGPSRRRGMAQVMNYHPGWH